MLAPFALRGLRGKAPLLRQHAGILLILAFTGTALFHSLVYLGLRTTTAVNGVLMNSSIPLFIVLCAWLLEGERVRPRQLAGVLVSLAGIAIIVSRGEPARLAALEFQPGDAWVLLAMPVWGVYSVLLRRRPAGLGGIEFLFVISLAGTLMLAPGAVAMNLRGIAVPTAAEAGAVLYIAVGTSVLAYICWNRGVATVGANVAGFTLHLLPAFGTLLAILFLGERFAAFHAAGIAAILAGVVIATRR